MGSSVGLQPRHNMTALMTPYIDFLVDFLQKDQTREILDATARFWYTEENYVSVNFIPSLVAVLLGLIIIVPLLSSIPSLFKSDSTGYGYGDTTGGYGAPEESYGSPEYRSYQEYGDVQEAVRSGQAEQQQAAQNRMDYARSIASQPLASQLSSSASLLQ